MGVEVRKGVIHTGTGIDNPYIDSDTGARTMTVNKRPLSESSQANQDKKRKREISDFFTKPKPKPDHTATDKNNGNTTEQPEHKVKLNAEDKESLPPITGKENAAKIVYKSRKVVVPKTEDVDSLSEVSVTAFDKQKWVSSLSDEQKGLLQLEIDTMDMTWLALLHSELTKDYFLDLKRFLKVQWDTKVTVFPPQEDIYSWTRLTPVDKVKVLILGQDPYHNFNQAHGLAFSVKDPNTKPPPSLRNIYKCLKIDYPDFEAPKMGDLTKWSDQGVLLLNTCLTVKAHNANSHSKRGWEQFTTTAVRKMIQYHERLGKGIVLMAWGSPAQKTLLNVGFDKELNYFLKSVHPSPLSASRGFFECRHFVRCNEWLFSHYGKEAIINWNLLEGRELQHPPTDTS